MSLIKKNRNVSVLVILLFILAFNPANAADQGVDVHLSGLKTNAKLHAPDTILADFFNGEPETRVIVIL